MRSAPISDVSRFGKRKPETARVTFGIPTPFPRRLFGTVSRRGRKKSRREFGETRPHTPRLSPSLPLARDVRQRAHRRATRPDTASIARLVPRAFSLPQREAPPLWETPRAATPGRGEKKERRGGGSRCGVRPR